MGDAVNAETTAYEAEGVAPRAFFENAEAFYRLLGSIFYLELTEEQIESLASLSFDFPDDGSEMSRGCRDIRRYLRLRGSNARQELACDYARIFLAAGVYEGETAVPFESVYTSEEGILMQDSRDDVVRILRENGFAVRDDLNVPEDHLAFELEFMSLLSGRIACGLAAEEEAGGTASPGAGEVRANMETQLAFIDEHLLSWIPQLQERVDRFAKLPFYPAIMKIAKSYIVENRSVLEEELAIR